MTLELSIRDAKARFSEAAEAASRGERVIITRHGAPFIEFVPARKRGGIDFGELEHIRKRLGLDGLCVELPADFDDPAFSRRVLGLDD